MFHEDEFGRFDMGREIGEAFEAAARRARERVGETAQSLKNGARKTHRAVRGRALTPGELAMIQAMFGTTKGIASARVFAYNFWWPYPNKRAMTPMGSIYFDGPEYRDDYSRPDVPLHLKALFMHESTHLYQTYILHYQLIFSGPFDRNYDYEIVPGKKFTDYGIEQMGQIVEDYYTLAHGGRLRNKAHKLADYAGLLPLPAK